jgi:hypothetical protein
MQSSALLLIARHGVNALLQQCLDLGGAKTKVLSEQRVIPSVLGAITCVCGSFCDGLSQFTFICKA